MKNKRMSKLYKRILIVAFIAYFIYTIVMQQKTLNAYSEQKADCNNQIEMAQDENEELKKMKENINSDEYIEQIAREKLGMYYPNERVYIDVEK